jgi:hypothetical protein
MHLNRTRGQIVPPVFGTKAYREKTPRRVIPITKVCDQKWNDAEEKKRRQPQQEQFVLRPET